jgi:hypothetical protein
LELERLLLKYLYSIEITRPMKSLKKEDEIDE